MSSNKLLPRLALILLLCSAVTSAVAQQVRTMPRGLDQLTQQAELIVRGTILSSQVEPHPQFKNIPTVLVTMQVDDTLKGSSRKTLQFRQYVWDIRERMNATSYVKGQEMMLLLGPTSRYGLRSPVGMEQGRFVITRDASGKAHLQNGRGNAGLFQSVEQRSKEENIALSPRTRALVRKITTGPIALEDFEQAVRNFAGGAR